MGTLETLKDIEETYEPSPFTSWKVVNCIKLRELAIKRAKAYKQEIQALKDYKGSNAVKDTLEAFLRGQLAEVCSLCDISEKDLA